MSLLDISGNLLYVAFLAYLIATFFFGGAIKSNQDSERAAKRAKKWGNIGITITILGFITNLGFFITRWMYINHAPVSNMFEFTTTFGMFLVGAFILIYFMYRVPSLGLIALPIALLIIAYASMFPSEARPLVPSLQSHWLAIHVITAAIGQSILAISAVAGLIYLLKHVDPKKKTRERFGLEFVLYGLVLVLGFVVITSVFKGMGYEAQFNYVNKNDMPAQIVYNLPPLFGMHESEALTKGTMEPLVEMPAIIHAKKLTTVVWSILTGSILYLLIRLITRRRILEMLHPFVQKVNSQLIDEIGYRSVLIGFPVFTLGALIFAMFWAQVAWSRFWGWDPKEVWALITWLFYAAFLHLRLSKGWEGKKSAWLALIGFSIIIFNLVAVNLVLAGLHSYASM